MKKEEKVSTKPVKEPKAPKEKKVKEKKVKEKKVLTEAQVERRAELIKTLKSAIAPTVAIAVVALIIFIAVKLANAPEVYEDVRAYVREVEEGADNSNIVLESDSLVFTMDPETTQFTVKQKATGKVWSSYAEGAADDPLALGSEKDRLSSNLILAYSQVNGLETVFDTHSSSVAHNYYQIEQEGDTIKLFYSMGSIEKEYIIPPIIVAENLDALKANLDKDGAQYISQYYKKYDIDKLSGMDNKEELLANYPIMKDEIVYVIRNPRENVKKELEKRFEQAGYTYDDFLRDKALDNSVKTSDKPVFNVEMDFRLEGNDLVVEIPFSSVGFKSQYPVSYIIPLPYFGAADTTKTGSLFVPEGGGAMIDYNNGKSSQSDYYANVYGWDMCLRRDYVIHNTRAYFNVFGQATEGSSYICIMEQGASYAAVRAAISGRINSYNYVDAKYTLCPGEQYKISNISNADVFSYLTDLPDEAIVQRYRFIDSEDYVDMAREYGKYLENEYKDYMKLNTSDNAPVAVEIVGAVDKVKQILGVPVSRPLKLTTYKAAGEIIEDLTNYEIGDLSVKYTGWCNGGVNQKILKNVNTIGALGSSSDLKKLGKKADELGVDLYLDGVTQYEHQSTIFNGFISFFDAARLLTKERAELYQYSAVTYAAREGAKSYYLLHNDVALKMAANLIKAAGKYNTGVSFNDVGMDLSSDFYRKNTVSREQTLNQNVDILSNLNKDGKNVMINMGNSYATPYVNVVTNMDLKGSDYTLLDRDVPFYQMAIHGFVNYTDEPLNISGNDEEILLRSAEYGAGLSFTLMDESSFALQKTLYSEYYGCEYASWKDRMISICERYNKEMSGLFNQRMVGHSIDGDLTVTEYEDGTKVYVNYSFENSYTTADGQTVAPRDYKVVR